MKNELLRLLSNGKQLDKQKKDALIPDVPEEPKGSARRDFLKKSALGGGLALGGMLFSSTEDTLAQSTSKVNRNSSPSELKITDMRYIVPMTTVGRCPIIRIETNQGI